MSVSIDGHICLGIACHEVKGTCILNLMLLFLLLLFFLPIVNLGL